MSEINEYVTAINLVMGSDVTLHFISLSSSILASYLVFHHDRILLMRYAAQILMLFWKSITYVHTAD